MSWEDVEQANLRYLGDWIPPIHNHPKMVYFCCISYLVKETGKENSPAECVELSFLTVFDF